MPPDLVRGASQSPKSSPSTLSSSLMSSSNAGSSTWRCSQLSGCRSWRPRCKKTAMEGKGRGVKECRYPGQACHVAVRRRPLGRASSWSAAMTTATTNSASSSSIGSHPTFAMRRRIRRPGPPDSQERRDPPALAAAAANGRHQPRATSKDVGLLVQRHEAAAGYRRGITRCHEEHVPRWTGPWAGCRGTPSTASVFCALVGICQCSSRARWTGTYLW